MNDDQQSVYAEDLGIAPDEEEAGSGSETLTEWVEATDNPGEDNSGDDTGGDTVIGGTAEGNYESGYEQAGDTGEVSSNGGGKIADDEQVSAGSSDFEYYPEDYVTSEQVVQLHDDLVLVNSKADMLFTSSIVLVIALFSVLGSIAVQTMIRSFERGR